MDDATGNHFLFGQNKIQPQEIQLALVRTQDHFSDSALHSPWGWAIHSTRASEFMMWTQAVSAGLGLRWWSVLHGMSQRNFQGRRDDNYCRPTNGYGLWFFLSLCLDDLAVGFKWEREPLPLFSHVIGGSIARLLGSQAWVSFNEWGQHIHVAKSAGSGQVHQSATMSYWLPVLLLNLPSNSKFEKFLLLFLINYLSLVLYSLFKCFLLHFKSNTRS